MQFQEKFQRFHSFELGNLAAELPQMKSSWKWLRMASEVRITNDAVQKNNMVSNSELHIYNVYFFIFGGGLVLFFGQHRTFLAAGLEFAGWRLRLLIEDWRHVPCTRLAVVLRRPDTDRHLPRVLKSHDQRDWTLERSGAFLFTVWGKVAKLQEQTQATSQHKQSHVLREQRLGR